jgi:hypothetical protein
MFKIPLNILSVLFNIIVVYYSSVAVAVQLLLFLISMPTGQENTAAIAPKCGAPTPSTFFNFHSLFLLSARMVLYFLSSSFFNVSKKKKAIAVLENRR